jgi:hypothetical protein
MRGTRFVGAAAGLLLLSGCVYGYQSVAAREDYSPSGRPEASYYCYDCHGYRYFDPYYDWCVNYGFLYRWTEHPRARALYRSRYVRIKESHPDYGRYRYRDGYRSEERYRQSVDYERWRDRGDSSPRAVEPKVREKKSNGPGIKHDKGRREKGRGDDKPRSAPPGGVT